MSFSYNRLWKLLIDQKMTKTQLREQSGFSTKVLSSLNKGEPVHMKHIEKICQTLNCEVSDILEIIPDK